MAKPYHPHGAPPPLPKYDVPFMFRGKPRIIHYTLYLDDKGERHANQWFSCKYGECIAGEANDWECADDCQPDDLNQVEQLAVDAAVAADANKD